MEITRIQIEVGCTMQAGDFQSVKASVALTADLTRADTVEAAAEALRSLAIGHLTRAAHDAHPDSVRKRMLSVAEVPNPPSAEPVAEPVAEVEEKTKRTRRTKEQMAADAAKAATPAKLADVEPDNKLLKAEAEQLSPAADDDDALLDAAEVEVTRDTLLAKLREVQKVKPAALAAIFRRVGVQDFRSAPDSKYQQLFALAVETLVA